MVLLFAKAGKVIHLLTRNRSCLLPIAYCLLPVACCLLHVPCRLLPAAYCLLPIACCLLPAAYYLLPTRNASCDATTTHTERERERERGENQSGSWRRKRLRPGRKPGSRLALYHAHANTTAGLHASAAMGLSCRLEFDSSNHGLC
jgi:hypothetical protein